MIRSKEVAFGFAHAEKARPEIRMLLTDFLTLARGTNCKLKALEELNRQFR